MEMMISSTSCAMNLMRLGRLDGMKPRRASCFDFDFWSRRHQQIKITTTKRQQPQPIEEKDFKTLMCGMKPRRAPDFGRPPESLTEFIFSFCDGEALTIGCFTALKSTLVCTAILLIRLPKCLSPVLVKYWRKTPQVESR
jgi:hypothetical protein